MYRLTRKEILQQLKILGTHKRGLTALKEG